jgi:hypothetical protein
MFPRGEEGKSVDSPIFPNPIPGLHMVRMGVLSESGSLGLLRSEETLMSLSDLEEPSLCISMISLHNTILQLNRGFMQICARGKERKWPP